MQTIAVHHISNEPRNINELQKSSKWHQQHLHNIDWEMAMQSSLTITDRIISLTLTEWFDHELMDHIVGCGRSKMCSSMTNQWNQSIIMLKSLHETKLRQVAWPVPVISCTPSDSAGTSNQPLVIVDASTLMMLLAGYALVIRYQGPKGMGHIPLLLNLLGDGFPVLLHLVQLYHLVLNFFY